MSLPQKILLSILGFYVIFDFVLGSLVGLYLWDSSKNVQTILLYYITLFASILVATQLSAKVITKFGAKRTYIISIILGLFQALLVLTLKENISSFILPFAVLAGSSIGLQAMAYTLTVAQITNSQSTTTFLSIKSALMNLVSIVSIPIITYLIQATGSYTIAYYLGLLAGIIVTVLITWLPTNILTKVDSNSQSIKQLFAYDEVRIYLLTRFLYGLYNGPIWALLGIVTFMFIGNVSSWGFLSTLFTILNIIGAYIYSRIRNPGLHRGLVILSTFIFSFIAIVLATNWTLATFLLYQLGVVLLNASFSIHYEGLVYELINDNPEIADCVQSILRIGEVAIGLGRVIPLLFLLYFNFSFDNPLSLQLMFVGIAGIPLIITSLLSNIVQHTDLYVKMKA